MSRGQWSAERTFHKVLVTTGQEVNGLAHVCVCVCVCDFWNALSCSGSGLLNLLSNFLLPV